MSAGNHYQPQKTEMDKCIAAVIKRFPDNWNHIRRLAEGDPDFYSLCDDYFLALKTLNHWRAANVSGVAGVRVDEYQTAVREMEAEIQRYLLQEKKRVEIASLIRGAHPGIECFLDDKVLTAGIFQCHPQDQHFFIKEHCCN